MKTYCSFDNSHYQNDNYSCHFVLYSCHYILSMPDYAELKSEVSNLSIFNSVLNMGKGQLKPAFKIQV